MRDDIFGSGSNDGITVFDIAIDSEAKSVMRQRKVSEEETQSLLPALRFEVSEAARILRMSRAQLYNRINDGALKPQKDGARTYITRGELERYVDACGQ